MNAFATSPAPLALVARAHTVHEHGGPDSLGVPLHDFSTNSNACGPCPQALAALQQVDASRYPDPSYRALRAQLATFHSVDVARVLVAASASEFIYRITAWAVQQGAKAVRVPQHGYGDYAQAGSAWRLPVARSGAAGLQWYADPSSPLGQSEIEDVLAGDLGVARGAPSQTVVLDRAYEPLRLSGQCAWTPLQLAQAWQLYTPNKALGLTGVRAAYAIAPVGAELAVAQLERLCPSWPVGAHGVALLQAWVQPGAQAWLAKSLGTLKTWKQRQIALLQCLGWTCLPSHANFFCAQAGSDDLDADLQRLRGAGIKLRNAASFGLNGTVRLGVLPPAAQDALSLAWQDMRLGSAYHGATSPQILEST